MPVQVWIFLVLAVFIWKHAQAEHSNTEENLLIFGSKMFDIITTFDRHWCFIWFLKASASWAECMAHFLIVMSLQGLLIIKSSSLFLFKTIVTSPVISSVVFGTVLLCLCLKICASSLQLSRNQECRQVFSHLRWFTGEMNKPHVSAVVIMQKSDSLLKKAHR